MATPFRREDEGQSLIEVALVLPIFLLMVFGFISFAMVTYGLSNATYANHLLMRYACLHSGTSFNPLTTADINNIIHPYLNNFPSNSAATSVSWGSGAPVLGTSISTTISLTYTLNLPGLTLSPFTVKTKATGVVVQ